MNTLYYGIYIRTKRKGVNWNLWRLHNVCSKTSLEESIQKALETSYDKNKEFNIQGSSSYEMPISFRD